MNHESLKLENQLCFPLYAAAKEVVKKYRPLLSELNLTYTQYLVMMVLWEHRSMNVKALGEKLFLDSGTLTPLLKKMEQMKLLKRARSETDERQVMVSLSEQGAVLQEKAVNIPTQIVQCIDLEPDEAVTLYKLLYKILNQV